MNTNKTPEALIEKWKAETEEILAEAAKKRAEAEDLLANARHTDAEAAETLAAIEIAKQKQEDAHQWELVCIRCQKGLSYLLTVVIVFAALFTIKSAVEWFKPVAETQQIRVTGSTCAYYTLAQDGTITCR